MKKLIPSLFVLAVLASVILLFNNGFTGEKKLEGTCCQNFCPGNGTPGSIVEVYDGSTLVGSCTLTTAPCCTICGLNPGQTYKAVFSNSTCPNNSIKFSACTSINLAVPGCP